MQFSRSSLCYISLVVLLVGLVASSVSANAANPVNRIRRSVNFTPSWGKRSVATEAGGPSRLNFARQAGARAGEGCLTKGVYLEMMIDNLKAEMESYGDCVHDAFEQ